MGAIKRQLDTEKIFLGDLTEKEFMIDYILTDSMDTIGGRNDETCRAS